MKTDGKVTGNEIAKADIGCVQYEQRLEATHLKGFEIEIKLSYYFNQNIQNIFKLCMCNKSAPTTENDLQAAVKAVSLRKIIAISGRPSIQ